MTTDPTIDQRTTDRPPGTSTTTSSTTTDGDAFADEGSLLVEEQRFAIVPEWVIDADLSDAAFRLYALLLRYGNGTGQRMPARATLARRLRRSVDGVDRAMRQLAAAGMVRVEHRKAGRQYLSNRYHVRTSGPFPTATTGTTVVGGGRNPAATPEPVGAGGRTSAATPGRSSAPRVAADLRPDRESLTQRRPPPPAAASAPAGWSPVGPGTAVEVADRQLLNDCGIDDLEAFTARCVQARTSLGQPAGRWSAKCLLVALRMAVLARGWPAADAAAALLAVAGDVESRSPVRVAEAGPWWDRTPVADPGDATELVGLEERLDDLDGRRLVLQRQARSELTSEGLPVTRATVIRRACEILDHPASPDRHGVAGTVVTAPVHTTTGRP